MPRAVDSHADKVKKHIGLITVLFSGLTAVVGAVIAVDYHYARAADVKEMARSQNEQLQVLRQNNARSLMFQMEYYDNLIKQLEQERVVQLRERSMQRRSVPQTVPRDYDREIADARLKRDFIQRQLVEGSR